MRYDNLNPNWLLNELDAYPVENYVYMVKVPHRRPLFFQDEWNAFHHPLYLNYLDAKIVKIKVEPVSKENQYFRRLEMANNLSSNSHPTMITDDEYFNHKKYLWKRILHKWIFWWSIGLALNVITWLGKRLLPAWLSLTLSVIALVFFGISIWSNYWKK